MASTPYRQEESNSSARVALGIENGEIEPK
jgi:hypothetical protein